MKEPAINPTDEEIEQVREDHDGTTIDMPSAGRLDEEIERVREDHDFTARAERLLERDKELLERLAQ